MVAFPRRRAARATRLSMCIAAALAAAACQGPRGPQGAPGDKGATGASGPAGSTGSQGSAGQNGTDGTNGTNGTNGSPGPAGCDGAAPGQTPGLNAAVTITPPANGQYYDVGEQAVLTIQLTDRCNRLWHVSQLGTASLYMSGPREGLETKSAVGLLNAVTDRAAADHQHHFINLKSPSYADPLQANLSEAADGTITYTLAPVSTEAAGTYTIGVWAKSIDEHDQLFKTLDVQVKTATVETFVSGDPATASCRACHTGPQTGKTYMAHTFPGYSPVGNWALDSAPVQTCKLCHNQDGYSPNPIVRKVHGAHRGEHMVTPGVAHPEYGWGADTTLAEFTNVGFPSFPDMEKDCTACHVDDRWKTQPSRQACGSCHETVFFDTGTVSPPKDFGKPASGAPCTTSTDCTSYGPLVGCNTITGTCQLTYHPVEPDDTTCNTCHSADPATSIVSIPGVHEVYQRTRTRGLTLSNVALTGGTGPNGAFLVGDVPVLGFQLVDQAGAAVSDLLTNGNLSATAILGGPTEARDRVIGPLTVKSTGTLTYDSGTQAYAYTFPSGMPAAAQPAYNTSLAGTPLVPGTYTLWFYVNETLTVNGVRVRDAANASVDFRFGADGKIQPRQVVATQACDACHGVVQAHGGTRRVAEDCSMCHSIAAEDKGLGSKGKACTADAQCGGFAAGWEACQDTNNDGTPDTCVATADPTPGQVIDFAPLMHELHSARRIEGYSQRNNLVNPGKLSIMGGGNSVETFADILLPQDLRNCTKCHVDAGNACATDLDCGKGQSCSARKCVNTAWQQPSARACLSCHDAQDTFAHAALQTWTDPTTGEKVESCNVCHEPQADFAVAKVHAVNPGDPTYPRE